MDPDVVRRRLHRKHEQELLARLTSLELEVLALMAQGESNSALAQRLVVSEKAIAKHINSILAKLDLPPSAAGSRRVQAVLTYLRS